ncbi:metal tolerance protein 2 isoform X1 [Medicago truncatula]|uniref:Metal tolerance-like protein n=3 Tax=Medicago truncatula TaxID=3880 RepID=A0A072VN24_MEDTR|nr:metal tolerance protein 2 isoform X1 [Medicago truncatula]KEH43242.1 metal tolerance-like protein [Medicago truncatula]
MGFRFNNLNPIYRTCITRLSFSKHLLPPPESPGFFQSEASFISPQNPAFKISHRWHFGHSHDHDHHHPPKHLKEGENIFKLGLAADIALATGKAFTGYLSGSTAIIADAAHSISDVVLSGIALLSFKVAKAPRDKEHPYGHGKFETLGALGISCMLLATGGGIAWHAVDILMGLSSAGPEMVNQAMAHAHSHGQGGHHHAIDMDHPILALNMTLVSIGVKEGLYWITKQAGERQGSGLMKANAWHHRADAISSVVALVGVGGSILGVKFLDPLAGLLVSIMILKAGAEAGYQSILELVDAAIPSQHLDPIKQTIMQVDGVEGCHRLRGRRAGSTLYLDVNIEVDPFSSVSSAHDIGENVRRQIHKSHPTVTEMFIHIDPAMSHVSPSTEDQQDSWSGDMDQNSLAPAGDSNIEGMVSDTISANFPQMSVERITRHMFQSKIVLQIEVSMPPDIPIRHAMEMAEKAEREILKATSTIIHVGIQLRLGRPFPYTSHD